MCAASIHLSIFLLCLFAGTLSYIKNNAVLTVEISSEMYARAARKWESIKSAATSHRHALLTPLDGVVS